MEIWARAYDDTGASQPFTQPWNPKRLPWKCHSQGTCLDNCLNRED